MTFEEYQLTAAALGVNRGAFAADKQFQGDWVNGAISHEYQRYDRMPRRGRVTPPALTEDLSGLRGVNRRRLRPTGWEMGNKAAHSALHRKTYL